jgi:hypothetical protein
MPFRRTVFSCENGFSDANYLEFQSLVTLGVRLQASGFGLQISQENGIMKETLKFRKRTQRRLQIGVGEDVEPKTYA